MMQPRAQITVLLTLVATAVLYFMGSVTLSFIQPIAPAAMPLLPTVVVASCTVGTLLGWYVAPRLLAGSSAQYEAAALRRHR